MVLLEEETYHIEQTRRHLMGQVRGTLSCRKWVAKARVKWDWNIITGKK